MEPIWTTSNFSFEDLNDKTVEFFTSVHGVCRFMVRNPDNKLWISIRMTQLDQDQTTLHLTDQSLTQELVDCIERHPDREIAEFRLDSRGLRSPDME
jgi:hypothetical protein